MSSPKFPSLLYQPSRSEAPTLPNRPPEPARRPSSAWLQLWSSPWAFTSARHNSMGNRHHHLLRLCSNPPPPAIRLRRVCNPASLSHSQQLPVNQPPHL